MSIQVFNTLTRKKENFVPHEAGKVKMYVCGPTVYNYFHIGNARTFLVFDTIRRYLQYRGYDVTYVQNFTDDDDKIITRAHEEGLTPQEVADKYVEAYFTDADAIGIQRADIHPRVTEVIPEIVAMIQGLIETGNAYESQGDVYFATNTFAEYGKLSKQSLENLQAGARVEVSEKKRGPLDFALWKAAKPGEISWESPWGAGRPGWHIECSAMNLKYLGEQIDIHGGGVDLTFPHHENEIAQTEACTHKQFAKYWLHSEFLNMNNEKMSKSTGNFLTVRDILDKYPAAVLRFLLIQAHYRNPLNFSDEVVENASAGFERITTSIDNLKFRLESAAEGHAESIEVEKYRGQFQAAMDDDFNTADAITALFDLSRDANLYLRQEQVERQAIEAYLALFEELLGAIGITLGEAADELDAQVDALIAERTEARATKNWARADEIRDQLTAMGIILEDTPQGIRWRRK
ncbi:MAG: cysteine--tRNA ligase [Tumebacillaceae bacterium]